MSTDTAEKMIRIYLPHGLHVRPTQRVVTCAAQFQADVSMWRGDMCGDAKSALSLLALELLGDCTITVRATGCDAVDAVEGLCCLLHELAQENL